MNNFENVGDRRAQRDPTNDGALKALHLYDMRYLR